MWLNMHLRCKKDCPPYEQTLLQFNTDDKNKERTYVYIYVCIVYIPVCNYVLITYDIEYLTYAYMYIYDMDRMEGGAEHNCMEIL